MWTCPKCKEQIGDEFDSCWKCAGTPESAKTPEESGKPLEQLERFCLIIAGLPGILFLIHGHVQNSAQATFRIVTIIVGLIIGIGGYAAIKIYQHKMRGANARRSELVPYYDFATKKTVLIPKSELSPGVVLVQIQGLKQPVYVKAAQLKQGEYRHPPFQGDERAAIQSLVADLADVYARTYEEWEDGFRRDQTPAREIAGWVHLAAIIKILSEKFDFGPLERKECFRILVACFTGARETVRARSDPKLLSDDQVNLAVKYFYEGGYR